jgi:hypothetical protein
MSVLTRCLSGLLELGFFNLAYIASLILASFAMNGFQSIQSLRVEGYLSAAFQDASRLLSFEWPFFAIAVLTASIFLIRKQLDSFISRFVVFWSAFSLLIFQIGSVNNWPLIATTFIICIVVDLSTLRLRNRVSA